jgi:hypothetical protein
MKLGFTGTRNGMNYKQYAEFRTYVTTHKITEFHVGDCLGADAEAFDIVREFCPGVKIVGHPPDDDKHRAFCDYDEEREPKPYLERNHDIVDESDSLFAIPFTNEEVLRSGTWATIRYADKKQYYKITISWREVIK